MVPGGRCADLYILFGLGRATMKAVKKLFKRKKEGRNSSTSRPAGAVLSDAIPSTKTMQSVNNTRTSSMATSVPSDGAHTSVPMLSPTASLTSQQSAMENPRLSQSSDDATQLHANGARAVSARTSSSPPATTRAWTDIEEKSGGNGAVNESLRKGSGSAPRPTMMNGPEEIAVHDPHHLGKLGDAYDSIPLLEQTKLPRGGISMETKAVGRIQVRYMRAGHVLLLQEVISWNLEMNLFPVWYST